MQIRSIELPNTSERSWSCLTCLETLLHLKAASDVVEHVLLAAQLKVPVTAFPVTYKYAIRNSRGEVELESGDNRAAAIDLGELQQLSCHNWEADFVSIAAIPNLLAACASDHTQV